MAWTKAILPFLGLLLNGCSGQRVVSGTVNLGPADNSCTEQGVQDLIASLNAKFPKLEPFTSAIDTSRLLYQQLLAPDLAAVLKNYCSLYREKRLIVDRCPDSTGKTIAVNGFSLADEICKKRLDDFQQNLPCIISLTSTATTCHLNCSKYEQDSKTYISPVSSSQEDTKKYKSADCQYLKCEADCRRPIIDEKCGSVAASLETAALSSVFAGERYAYGVGQQQQQSFPQECRELIIITAADSPSTNGSATAGAVGSNGSLAITGAGSGADAPAAGATTSTAPKTGTGVGAAAAGTGPAANTTMKPAAAAGGSAAEIGGNGNGTSAGSGSSGGVGASNNSSAAGSGSAAAGNTATQAPKSGTAVIRSITPGAVGYMAVITVTILVAPVIL